MADLPDNDQQDFEVYPSSRTAAKDFTEALANLRQALKPADIASHHRAGENYEDFLLRLALSTTNSKAVLFRKNDSAEETRVQAWLSIVSEKSKAYVIQHSPIGFEGLSQDHLREIAKLSLHPENTQRLVDILARAYGVVLIVEPGFRAMKTDGCVFKLAQGTPVIGISVRYNRYDNFWFTLMHELAHIYMHYEQLDQPIIDDLDEVGVSEIEVEANIVAKDSLVSRQHWRLIWNARDNKRQFYEFCKQAEVNPVIAAGMLRYQTKNYALYPEYQYAMNIRKIFGVADD
ncbi:ImmA/IrrE family metallo-endopeptidase [Pseudomonas tohonis]|uniref:ImmA/IrrE family metallo-endopeptidase n=1 Tax=Pseudomonas tohonis TaxID=2725477 RepID=UPI001F2A5934|nr:ImmA/IrrE family metallo-endopeptidase [Pseudomonas tohonis]